MNDGFVPFGLAVKLKEKGYPQDGFIGYDEFRTLCIGDEHSIVCVSPTISQALKWLREEKKIYIVIAVNPTLSTKDKIAYYYQVYSNCNGVTSDYHESEECYAQWEECAIDSIEYVLDNLI